jgi:hypothetical protein
MSLQENKKVVRRIVELSNERNYEEAKKLYTDDFVDIV